jgi:hypothetical protein
MLQADCIAVDDEQFATIWATTASRPGRVEIEIKNAHGNGVGRLAIGNRETATRLLMALAQAANYAGILDKEALRGIASELGREDGRPAKLAQENGKQS